MFTLRQQPGTEGVSLWFYTSQVDEMYRLLKARQLEPARGALDGEGTAHAIVFDQDIEDMFYGARQFAVRDPNGYLLYFIASAG